MKRLALLVCVGAAMVLLPASAANAEFSFQTTALEPGGPASRTSPSVTSTG